MRKVCFLLLLVQLAWADPWHTLRPKSVKSYRAEWSDPQKGINGYHIDCFDEKDEWLGGMTFYLKEGFAGKAPLLKDLEGMNLRSPVKPVSTGGRAVLKMVREFSVANGQIHFWVQGKEGEWDLDLRADVKLN